MNPAQGSFSFFFPFFKWKLVISKRLFGTVCTQNVVLLQVERRGALLQPATSTALRSSPTPALGL